MYRHWMRPLCLILVETFLWSVLFSGSANGQTLLRPKASKDGDAKSLQTALTETLPHTASPQAVSPQMIPSFDDRIVPDQNNLAAMDGGRKEQKGVHIARGAQIHPQVKLIPHGKHTITIEEGVFIGEGSVIEAKRQDVMIHQGARIVSSHVTDADIGKQSVVGPGSVVEGGKRKATLGEASVLIRSRLIQATVGKKVWLEDTLVNNAGRKALDRLPDIGDEVLLIKSQMVKSSIGKKTAGFGVTLNEAEIGEENRLRYGAVIERTTTGRKAHLGSPIRDSVLGDGFVSEHLFTTHLENVIAPTEDVIGVEKLDKDGRPFIDEEGYPVIEERKVTGIPNLTNIGGGTEFHGGPITLYTAFTGIRTILRGKMTVGFASFVKGRFNDSQIEEILPFSYFDGTTGDYQVGWIFMDRSRKQHVAVLENFIRKMVDVLPEGEKGRLDDYFEGKIRHALKRSREELAKIKGELEQVKREIRKIKGRRGKRKLKSLQLKSRLLSNRMDILERGVEIFFNELYYRDNGDVGHRHRWKLKDGQLAVETLREKLEVKIPKIVGKPLTLPMPLSTWGQGEIEKRWPGVFFESPENTLVDPGVEIALGTTIGPNTVLLGKTVIGASNEIRQSTLIDVVTEEGVRLEEVRLWTEEEKEGFSFVEGNDVESATPGTLRRYQVLYQEPTRVQEDASLQRLIGFNLLVGRGTRTVGGGGVFIKNAIVGAENTLHSGLIMEKTETGRKNRLGSEITKSIFADDFSSLSTLSYLSVIVPGVIIGIDRDGNTVSTEGVPNLSRYGAGSITANYGGEIAPSGKESVKGNAFVFHAFIEPGTNIVNLYDHPDTPMEEILFWVGGVHGLTVLSDFVHVKGEVHGIIPPGTYAENLRPRTHRLGYVFEHEPGRIVEYVQRVVKKIGEEGLGGKLDHWVENDLRLAIEFLEREKLRPSLYGKGQIKEALDLYRKHLDSRAWQMKQGKFLYWKKTDEGWVNEKLPAASQDGGRKEFRGIDPAIFAKQHQRILETLSERLQRPIARIEDAPIEYLELLVTLWEAGVEEALSGRSQALTFQSGMEGISALLFSALKAEKPGEAREVIVLTPSYGGTHDLANQVKRLPGVTVKFVSVAFGEEKLYAELEKAISDKTRLVYFETPTNPTLDLVDIEKLVKWTGKKARAFGKKIYTAIDNTFATSAGQNPLALGVDFSLQTLTKGETGTGNVLGSVLIAKRALLEEARQRRDVLGEAINPQDALISAKWGIPLLYTRLSRQSENARSIATWLEEESQKERSLVRSGSVRYPGLSSHPQFALARRQMMNPGHMVYFEFENHDLAVHFVNLLRYFRLIENAVSLGQVRTLAEIPAEGTSSEMDEAAQKKAGLSPSGIRMSVGIEDGEDLLRELEAIFRILHFYREDLPSIPYRMFDGLFMAESADGKYLLRAIPELQQGLSSEEALHEALPWAAHMMPYMLTGKQQLELEAIETIRRTTDISEYNPLSLITHHTWLWGILSGDHASVTMSPAGSTIFRKATAKQLSQSFTLDLRKLGGIPQSISSLYARWGTPNSVTLEILMSGLEGSLEGALSLEVGGVSFPSVTRAMRTLILSAATPEEGVASRKDIDPDRSVAILTTEGSSLHQLGEYLKEAYGINVQYIFNFDSSRIPASFSEGTRLLILDRPEKVSGDFETLIQETKRRNPSLLVATNSSVFDTYGAGYLQKGVDYVNTFVPDLDEGKVGSATGEEVGSVTVMRRELLTEIYATRSRITNAIRDDQSHRAIVYLLPYLGHVFQRKEGLSAADGGTKRTPIPIAVGGNAFPLTTPDGRLLTPDEQMPILREKLRPIVKMARRGESILVTHGNGPQVGYGLRGVELAAEKKEAPFRRLPYVVGDTQGSMGHMIELTLENLLREENIHRKVAYILTHVVVNPRDPAFQNPTKYIGREYSAKEASLLAYSKGWKLKEYRRNRWRRLVASPTPKEIVEVDVVRRLLDHGVIVVAGGGGGIPVYRNELGELVGIEAVIDKDKTTALIGRELGAEQLAIMTAVDRVALDFETDEPKWLSTLTVGEARRHQAGGQFPAGSMGPKIEAAIDFLEHGGKEVIITDGDHLLEALEGKAGTTISMASKDGGKKRAYLERLRRYFDTSQSEAIYDEVTKDIERIAPSMPKGFKGTEKEIDKRIKKIKPLTYFHLLRYSPDVIITHLTAIPFVIAAYAVHPLLALTLLAAFGTTMYFLSERNAFYDLPQYLEVGSRNLFIHRAITPLQMRKAIAYRLARHYYSERPPHIFSAFTTLRLLEENLIGGIPSEVSHLVRQTPVKGLGKALRKAVQEKVGLPKRFFGWFGYNLKWSDEYGKRLGYALYELSGRDFAKAYRILFQIRRLVSLEKAFQKVSEQNDGRAHRDDAAPTDNAPEEGEGGVVKDGGNRLHRYQDSILEGLGLPEAGT